MEILRSLNFKVHGQILKFYKFTYLHIATYFWTLLFILLMKNTIKRVQYESH